jgi:uncharacterized Zn finger protein
MTETFTGAIPSLSDDEIRERVGPQSFQRGRQYFRDRAIYDMRQQGMSDEALEVIFEQTTPEERHTIAEWVREVMPQASGNFTANWRREAFGGFLLDLEAEALDDEAYLRICRESGRVNDLVERLLSLGRVEEEVQATAQASDYGMLTLAGIFDRHDHADLAQQLMEERAQQTEDTRVFDWLKDRYKLRRDFPGALELSEKLFRAQPDLTRYRELRELGRQTGRWEELRPQLLSFLSEKRWNDLLIAIYIDEGEIDLALETLRQHGSHVMGYSYGLYGGRSLALQVAKAAEKTRPYDALEIYGQQVQRLIDGRGRENYAEAARLLVTMRDMYMNLGERETWEGCLQDLRNRYKTLRALKDEMGQAGIL